MSNQCIIKVDNGPDGQNDPDVMFLTSVIKEDPDDCVFIKEVVKKVPTKPARNTTIITAVKQTNDASTNTSTITAEKQTTDASTNTTIITAEKQTNDASTNTSAITAEKETTDASTNTSVITAESYADEYGVICVVCIVQKSNTFNNFWTPKCGHVYCKNCIDRILNRDQLCSFCRIQLISTAGIICAEWDRRRGAQVYTIPLGGMVTRQPVSIGGSGSSYVYGYVDAHFKPKMSKEECAAFVTNTLTLAMTRDGSSGGVVCLAIITEASVERHLTLGNELSEFYQG